MQKVVIMSQNRSGGGIVHFIGLLAIGFVLGKGLIALGVISSRHRSTSDIAPVQTQSDVR